ncbi:hypothetical protein, partial [Mesorhizobium sp. M0058]|uniref:hypothetical protein n=1 Tax=Mesorhizobium sp. M0058 TaxID=2956865 RepID=UPI00333BE98C
MEAAQFGEDLAQHAMAEIRSIANRLAEADLKQANLASTGAKVTRAIEVAAAAHCLGDLEAAAKWIDAARAAFDAAVATARRHVGILADSDP